MQIFFNWFYMQLIAEEKKSERIPVSRLFSKIKALGALNEKQKSGRKARGDASGSARPPRRRFVFGERVKRAESRAIHGFCGGKTCACLGRPERSDGCPAAGVAAAGHRRRPTCKKTSTRLTLNRPFSGIFRRVNLALFVPQIGLFLLR
mgnify:CR=1 FL=1